MVDWSEKLILWQQNKIKMSEKHLRQRHVLYPQKNIVFSFPYVAVYP